MATMNLDTAMAAGDRFVLAAAAYSQLPRALKDKYWVKVWGDPFGLKLTAEFRPVQNWTDLSKIDPSNPSCELTTVVEGGKVVSVKIPDEFMARFCLDG